MTSRLENAADPVLGHELLANPPKPRRIILDLFGDYLRYTDAEVRLGHLTALLDAFDIAPASVRVTMSRLRREGWFTSRREGRETIYQLTPPMIEILDAGRKRIFGREVEPDPWPETWTMVMYQLSEEERHQRERLRRDLLWNGFGLLGTSTWVAPGDRRADAKQICGRVADDQVEVLRCLTDGPEHDRDLVSRCWDLPSLAVEYQAFLEQYGALGGSLRQLTGAEALAVRTLLVSAYRHFPYRDPGLPAQLTPLGWPGDEARRLFLELHEHLRSAANAYVSEVLGRPIDDGVTHVD